MVDEGILEALCNGGREILQFFFGKRQRRYNLAVNRLFHKGSDFLVVHAVADNIESFQICAENERCVRTV